MIMNKKIYCYIGITKGVKKKALCVDKICCSLLVMFLALLLRIVENAEKSYSLKLLVVVSR